jgi:hypothetical protein
MFDMVRFEDRMTQARHIVCVMCNKTTDTRCGRVHACIILSMLQLLSIYFFYLLICFGHKFVTGLSVVLLSQQNLIVSNLDDGLAECLAGEHLQEGAVEVLNALVLGVASLDGAVGNVLGHVLAEGVNVGGEDVVVPVDEAANGDALAEDVRQVGDSVLLLNGLVVLRCLLQSC